MLLTLDQEFTLFHTKLISDSQPVNQLLFEYADLGCFYDKLVV